MLEARGRSTGRIATLPGSAWEGEPFDDEAAKRLAPRLTCTDPNCTAPLAYVRASARARAHWSHRPGTSEACASTSGGEGAWHLWVKEDVLTHARKEFGVPGARCDAVVPRRGGRYTGLEIQASPIDPAIVLRRHAAHRAAGLAGTIWLLGSTRLAPGDRPGTGTVATGWVVDLLEACMATPRTAAGDAGYGCTAGFLDGTGVRFVDRAQVGNDQIRRSATVTTTELVPLEALRWWSQGVSRPRTVPAGLEAAIRTLDAAPTRRVKEPALPWAA